MIDKVIAIAKEAGRIILEIKEKGFEVQTKEHEFDFVTTADLEAEKYILSTLQKEFPEHNIVGEESGTKNKDSQFTWYVDPLDGTKDFRNGGDGFSVMIGLCKNNEPILGVVFLPAANQLYYAQQEKGAFLDDGNSIRQIHVSTITKLSDAKLVTRISHGEKRESDALIDSIPVKEHIQASSVGNKLGLIASGLADAHVNTNKRVQMWDTCAPEIILKEAGGSLTDVFGNSLTYKESSWKSLFIASNSLLHKSLITAVKNFD